MLVDKEVKIAKVLSNTDMLEIRSQSQADKYLPFAKKFIETQGVEEISKLILGYFLKVLTN